MLTNTPRRVRISNNPSEADLSRGIRGWDQREAIPTMLVLASPDYLTSRLAGMENIHSFS